MENMFLKSLKRIRKDVSSVLFNSRSSALYTYSKEKLQWDDQNHMQGSVYVCATTPKAKPCLIVLN